MVIYCSCQLDRHANLTPGIAVVLVSKHTQFRIWPTRLITSALRYLPRVNDRWLLFLELSPCCTPFANLVAAAAQLQRQKRDWKTINSMQKLFFSGAQLQQKLDAASLEKLRGAVGLCETDVFGYDLEYINDTMQWDQQPPAAHA